MSSAGSHLPIENQVGRLVRVGLTTGVIDGSFSSVLTQFFYGSTATRLFQGVAATLLGNAAFDGGARTAAVGLAMHFGVAFGWSAVFLVMVMRSRRIRALLARPSGIATIAAVYGPAVWMMMSLAVIPFLLQRPPVINFAGGSSSSAIFHSSAFRLSCPLLGILRDDDVAALKLTRHVGEWQGSVDEFHGDAGARQRLGAIADLKMQVRLGPVARRSELSDRLPCADAIA